MPLRHPVAALLLAVALIFNTAPSALAKEDFETNAEGMALSDMIGRTMVGVTRGKSSVFSVYLGADGTAEFHFSNGKRQSATWRSQDSVILCFKGLVAERPGDEVCKRAMPSGRGLDWMTVELQSKNGTTTWSRATPGEEKGSSQMVYSFDGKVEVDQQSYVTDLRKWPGHLVVGRTLKDREAWFALFDTDGAVDFVFASGKREKGSYTVSGDQICMNFPSSPATSGCRRPTIKDGIIRWVSTADGGSSSEIVFMKQMESGGPQGIAVLSPSDTRYFAPSPNRLLILSNDTRAQEVKMWNLSNGRLLGSVRTEKTNDLEFSPDGRQFAAVQDAGVEVFDTASGAFLFAIERSPGGAKFREAAFLPGGDLLIGDQAGVLHRVHLSDSTEVQTVSFGTQGIANMAADASGRLLVGDLSGKIAMLGPDLAPLPGLVSQGKDIVSATVIAPDGRHAIALSRDNVAHLFDLQPGAVIPVKTAPLPTQKAWSAEFNASSTEVVVTMEGALAVMTVPGLQITSRLDASDQTIWRAAFVGDTRAMVFSDNGGRLRLFAPDNAAREAWRHLPTSVGVKMQAPAETMQAQRPRLERANALFDSGDCASYAVLRKALRLSDRREDCEGAVVLRQARAEFNRAIATLNCDAAAGLLQAAQADQAVLDRCRAGLQEKIDTDAFASATRAGDCEAIRNLEDRLDKHGAADQCVFEKLLKGDNARTMYLAAVKLDTAGETARAERLYTEIMSRFAEDDVAIDAANRLTALADLAKIREGQAAQAAAQDEAIKAAEARAKAAEEAANAAAREAERQRIAREEEARRADQARSEAAAAAAAAAAQPQRNTACDYVTVGQEFTIVGAGFLGMDAHFVVVGISREGGIVTAREQSFNVQRQFSCYDVK